MSAASGAWDQFWKYDRLASFFTGAGAPNYQGAIAEQWRDFFNSLDKGSRILDLCTGNGAVAVLAVEAARDFEVTGIDFADIDPAAYVSGSRELAEVRFVGRTRAEDLPFSEASFDAAVSQYGIEYSDLAQSLPEAVRVLARGGKLRFAVHAAEGSVAAGARASLADSDFLLADIDLFGRARRCFEAVLRVERHAAATAEQMDDAQTHFAAFGDALKATAERSRAATDQAMLQNVHAVLYDAFQKRGAVGIDVLLGKARELEDEVRAHRERQAALLDAARSRSEMDELAKRLPQLGLADVRLGEQHSADDLLAHVIEARRPAL